VNAPVRRVAVAALVLFGLLIANANWVQVFHGDSLRTDPGNTRVLLDEYERERGAILVGGQSTIAKSVETTDKLKYLRQYPRGPMYAPVTGFYSLIYGATGIEHAENDVLTGSDSRLFTRRLSDLLTGRDPKGGAVELTIDPKAQRAAYEGLKGQRGAVVALDPTTGAILAMATSPSFDPNPISSHDIARIRRAYNQAINDPDQPALNRTISNTYPPGSTFKVVISAAALQSGYKPDTKIDCPTRYKLPQSRKELENFGGEVCSAPQVTLEQALTKSYNTAFAKLGVSLGEESIRRQSEAFGINDQPFTVPLQVAPSSIGEIQDGAALAQSSIGQRDVRLTTLQGAMIAAAIANQGELMKPYLVKRLLASDFSEIDSTEPKPLNPDQPQAVPSEVAGQLTQMMRSVVERGTGTAAQIPGVPVAGKTGTAENAPGKQPHAWFIGFADSNGKKVAVSVMLENAGTTGSEVTGGKAAAPIAKSVMQAVLGIGGGG